MTEEKTIEIITEVKKEVKVKPPKKEKKIVTEKEGEVKPPKKEKKKRKKKNNLQYDEEGNVIRKYHKIWLPEENKYLYRIKDNTYFSDYYWKHKEILTCDFCGKTYIRSLRTKHFKAVGCMKAQNILKLQKEKEGESEEKEKESEEKEKESEKKEKESEEKEEMNKVPAPPVGGA